MYHLHEPTMDEIRHMIHHFPYQILTTLPNDIYYEMMMHMDVLDILNLCLTSKRLYKLFNKQLFTVIAKREQISPHDSNIQNWIINYLKYSADANRIMKYIKKSHVYYQCKRIYFNSLYYINDEPISKHDLFKYILKLVYDDKYICTIVKGCYIPVTKKYLIRWKNRDVGISKISRKLYNQIYL